MLTLIYEKLDQSVSSLKAAGGLLRLVSNPLKVCVLLHEFSSALEQRFSHAKSPSHLLKGIAMQILKTMKYDYDSIRVSLLDTDLSGRTVISVIAELK